MGKIFIEVIVKYKNDGTISPLLIILEDGREYTIDRVFDVKKAASLKAGGKGIRYNCRILNKNVALFLDENKWFIET